jgi:hypothetical protein
MRTKKEILVRFFRIIIHSTRMRAKCFFMSSRQMAIILLTFACAFTTRGDAAVKPATLDGQYVRDWLVLGPINADIYYAFEGTDRFPFADATPAEGEICSNVLGGESKWSRVHSETEALFPSRLLGNSGRGQLLAYFELLSDKDCEAILIVSMSKDTPIYLTVNQEILTFPDPPQLFRMDGVNKRVQLRAGINRCFVLCECSSGRSAFAVRASAADRIAQPAPLPVASMSSSYIQGCFLLPERFKAGDDPAWANPNHDDSDWTPCPPKLFPENSFSPEGDAPVVWYRFRLQVPESALTSPFVFDMYPYDNGIEIYVNGVKKRHPQFLRTPWPDFPRSCRLSQTETTIAVRWDRTKASIDTRDSGFCLLLHTYGEASTSFAAGIAQERTHAIHRVVLISLFAVFLLFHATIFIYLPKRKEYLLFSITLASCLAGMLSLHISETTVNVLIWKWAYGRFFLGFLILSALMGLALIQQMLLGRICRTFPVYGLIALICYICALTVGKEWAHLYPILIAPETARICWLGFKARKPGAVAMIIFAFFLLILICAHALGSMMNLPQENPLLRNAAWYGFASFSLLVALLLARDFSRATRKLETFSEELEDQV